MLLLSAESSRSARETPVVGRGCSRCRGDVPSLPPSPGVGGLASAGSKASSSAGGDRGQQVGGLTRGKRAGRQAGRHFSRLNGSTEAVALLCPLLTLITDLSCQVQGAGDRRHVVGGTHFDRVRTKAGLRKSSQTRWGLNQGSSGIRELFSGNTGTKARQCDGPRAGSPTNGTGAAQSSRLWCLQQPAHLGEPAP